MGGFIEEFDFYLASGNEMLKRINKQIQVLKDEDAEDYNNIIEELKGFKTLLKKEKEENISVQYYILKANDLTGITMKNITYKLLELGE